MPKCKICKTPFKPFSSLEQWCSPDCGYELAKRRIGAKVKSEAKIERKELKKRKDKLKSKAEFLKEAQVAFNAYVRTRDKKDACISCGKYSDDSDLLTGSRWDAGHYRSRGAAPELRFEELNCHKQCVKCNRELSGNIVEFRIRLKDKIGEDKLNWLEGKHEPKRYTIDQLKEIKAYYKEQTKLLR